MIWQLTGKLWPGLRIERRRSTGMCEINDDYDNIALDDLHVCDSDCPLLTEGTCPNALRITGSRKDEGRLSLGETRLAVKSKRFWFCAVCTERHKRFIRTLFDWTNRTKCANFRGNPLFQSYVQHGNEQLAYLQSYVQHKNKQEIYLFSKR